MPSSSQETPPGIAEAPWLNWPETRTVFEVISTAGFVVRAVGGAVRNTLLDEPVTEVDLATDAPPQAVLDAAARADLSAIPTGIEHGTVTLVATGRSFEVTTLRCDVETHGRHATVAFTSDWQADAERRDFTMNALYADADGTVFDPLGGYADLKARKVQFIGDPAQRIAEDYLRILRFFRINAQFGRPPYCQSGLNACVAARGGLASLSSERVHSEIMRLLAARDAATALEAMYVYGLLPLLLGGVVLPGRFARLCELERALGLAADAVRRLFALSICVDEDVERLTCKLRLPNADAMRLRAMLLSREFANRFDKANAKLLLYRLGADAYGDVALLAGAQADHQTMTDAWAKATDLPSRWQPPDFPLNGADLIELGVDEGPRLGKLMAALQQEWVSQDFAADRDALLERARSLISSAKSGCKGDGA